MKTKFNKINMHVYLVVVNQEIWDWSSTLQDTMHIPILENQEWFPILKVSIFCFKLKILTSSWVCDIALKFLT